MKRSSFLVPLLLVAYFFIAISAVSQKSNTFDEIQHITAGYAYDAYEDYRLHPENGILPQRLAALPLLFSNVHFPSLQQPAWWSSNVLEIGYQFLFEQQNDADRILLYSRMMIALLAVALGFCVYACSAELFGATGGLVSLLLYVFCPTVLANGALATSDLAVAFFFTTSVLLFWKMLHEPSLKFILLSSISVAALVLAKFSAFIFIPMAVLLLLLRAIFGPRTKYSKIISALLIHLLIFFTVIWSLYGFRYSAFNLSDPHPASLFEPWEHFQQVPLHSAIEVARERHLLPEAYLYGFATVLKHGESRRAFLNGQFSTQGWWYFFPYSFLVKTPLPTLFLLLIALAAAVAKWKRADRSIVFADLYRAAPLLVLLIVYWSFALTTNLNIGHRHLLPTYPAILILAGAVAWWLRRSAIRVPAIVIAAMLIWLIGEMLFTYPNFLAYFNEVAGGPKNGYKHLVDSSLDWGQDLPALKQWLDRNVKEENVYLSYFGTSSPEYYAIHAKRLPSYIDFHRVPQETQYFAGVYAISATMLQGVYLYAAGPWTPAYERTYQKLQMATQTPTTQFYLQQLRFARLCAYLRQRPPDDSVGNSILIYRLTDADIDTALKRRLPES